MKVLLVRSDWDLATKYLSVWGHKFIEENEIRGWGHIFTDLYGDDATPQNFEENIGLNEIFLGLSHGNKTLFTGQNNEVLIHATVNADVMSGKPCYLAACQTGSILIPRMVEETCPEAYGYQCLSEDTDVLTNNGWKNMDVISKKDYALTLNRKSKSLEYSPVEAIFKYPYIGTMFHIHNKRNDQLVTPNHRIPYIPQPYIPHEGNIRFGHAKELSTRPYFFTPIQGSYSYSDYPIKDKELLLWAWILSEGTIRHNKGKFKGKRNGEDRIVIGQSIKHEAEIQRIREILGRNNIVWQEKDYKNKGCLLKTGQYITASDVPVRRFIFYHNGFSKDMPNWFLKLSRRQAQLFLSEYRLGDGSKRNFILYTSKTRDVDILTALAIIGGYAFNIYPPRNPPKGCYDIGIISNFTDKTKVKTNTEQYTGKVWCITTNNGTIITRRNGKPAITGNSDWVFVYHPEYYPDRVLEDPYATPFFDCMLTTGYAVLLRKSPLEVYDETIARYTYWWNYWLKQNDPFTDDILTWLNWNKRNFIAVTPDGIHRMAAPIVPMQLALPMGAAALFLLATIGRKDKNIED